LLHNSKGILFETDENDLKICFSLRLHFFSKFDSTKLIYDFFLLCTVDGSAIRRYVTANVIFSEVEKGPTHCATKFTTYTR